jgi:hypothetical protein
LCKSLAVLGALVGCRDSTSPDKPFTVALTIDAPPAAVISDTPDGPRITCTFGVTAKATGTGSGTWIGARTLWYFGSDRTVAIDTTSNGADEVQRAFGASTISGGQSQHATWHLFAGAPFEASLGFEYAQGLDPAGTASTRVTCGPTPEHAVVPTVTQISVPNENGDLNIGQTIQVTYQATGSSGIWLTVVDINGGFTSEQVFGERLATTVNRTVNFSVPYGVLSGVPITISVRAYNAALVGSAKSLGTQLKYTDNTPPTLTFARTRERLQKRRCQRACRSARCRRYPFPVSEREG